MKNFIQKSRYFRIVVGLIALAVLVNVNPTFADALKKFAHQPLNDLANETSPYLVQHSRDLVKWNGWNEKTLAKAKKSGKPIYLSIGYSACHWCHVMQKKSFNNAQVAKLINEHFIPVLVDREQRPDLDETYMIATQAISGNGGWPNNVLLTPDLKPFYGGVYFPPESLIKLLTLVATDWNADKMPIQLEADRISTILASYFNRKNAAREITLKTGKQATIKLLKSFDGFNGGIGTAPKHFNAPTLLYLAKEYERTQNQMVLQTLKLTLKAIAKGGVQDHLAGGFHRYAIDNAWRIPHFEKMLYDQAQLAQIFSLAGVLSNNSDFADVADKTFQYVLNDLTAPQGGFYSTRNADSQGEEGTYYVWTPEQVLKALGKTDGAFLIEKLGTVSDGDFAGKIIIHRDFESSDEEHQRITALFAKLKTNKANRPAPFRDEKILASWNGLMISAFATGAQSFANETYKQAAINAGEFVWKNMRDADGNLFRSYFKGKPQVVSTLVDYTNMANAYIDLYDLTANNKWLNRAQALADKINIHFKDKQVGDFFFTSTKQGFARIKLRADTAMPAGNAMALKVFQRLAARSLNPAFQRQSEGLIAALSHDAIEDPKGGATAMTSALDFLYGHAGPIQYAGKGQVKLISKISADNQNLTIRIKIAENWHINSNKPFQSDFVPTSLEMVKSDGKTKIPFSVTYPKPVSRVLGFQKKPLSLFENTFDLKVRLTEPAAQSFQAKVKIQACNNTLCLLPQIVDLRVNRALKPRAITTSQ